MFALLSVSDKTNLLPFANALIELNITILATGGTASFLKANRIPLTEISDYTGFPEIMDGRVKTLHPKIYGGILARRGIDDAILEEHHIPFIDIVVVNLYPFQKTKTIEHIDIGGPTLLRAAAKNHDYVTAIVDPKDYIKIIDELKISGHTELSTRRYLAQKIFAHTASYDAAIANYFAKPATSPFPDVYQPTYRKAFDLRYGENPHQEAVFYRENNDSSPDGTLAQATLLQGKPLSYNNMIDANAALACVQGLDPSLPGCAIIKHATPCGVAQASTLLDAYQKAFSTDPLSAFGGIIAFNKPLNANTAKIIVEQQFVEVIIVPALEEDTPKILSQKKNLRVLITGESHPQENVDYKISSISGGLLIQQQDSLAIQPEQWQTVTQRSPTPEEMQELCFAWRVVRFVKSNAIVYSRNYQTLGIGAGQTSRVFSAEIAVLKATQAHLSLTGAVMASDAFFPFADTLEIAAKAGITAVIQPGGSMRDQDIVAAADTLGLAMIFTGTRHFLH